MLLCIKRQLRSQLVTLLKICKKWKFNLEEQRAEIKEDWARQAEIRRAGAGPAP